MSWIDRNDQERLLADVAQRVTKRDNPDPRDEQVAKRLGEIYRMHPYIQTGVALSLAEANADDKTVNSAALQSAITMYGKAYSEAREPVVENPFPKGKVTSKITGALKGFFGFVGNQVNRVLPLKAASKVAQGIGQFPAEYYSNYFSRLTDPDRPTSDTEGIIASTTLGALLQHWDESGSGYFLGGEAEKKRVEKVRRYRWQLKNGDSSTIGRGTAQVIFEPGSAEYNFLSGLVDGAVSFFSDPTNIVVDDLAKVSKLKKVIPALETQDEIRAAMILAENTGLSRSDQAVIDSSQFFGWLDGRRGRRLVEKLASETNELKIMEGMNYKITPEDARLLAQTSDPDQIRGIIALKANRLNEVTTKGFIPFAGTDTELPYASPWNTLGQRLPGYTAMKNSRWFTTMPKNYLMVNGTPKEKSDGLRNIANWVKTLGVDPYSGDGEKLMSKAFDFAGANGTANDAKQVLDLLVGDSKNPGVIAMALKNRGVDTEVIDEVYRNFEEGVGQLRSYGLDEAGRVADTGMFHYMAQFATDDELRDMLREMFPNTIPKNASRADMDDFIANLDESAIRNIGPSALSEMLNNVVMLPDVRQMRLLTNPFIGGQTAKLMTPAVKAGQIVEFVQNELWRPYALATFGFVMRNTMDAQLRMAMNGITTRSPLNFMLLAINGTKMQTIMEKVTGRELSTGWATITGKQWVEAGQDVFDDVESVLEDFADFNHFESPYWVDDPAHEMERLVRDGQVTNVAINEPTYVQGVVDEARLMFTRDPLAVTAARLQDLPVDMQASVIAQWLGSDAPDAIKARRTFVQQLKYGVRFADSVTGRLRSSLPISNADQLSTAELVDIWFQKGRADAVATFTLENPEMRVLVGYNDVAIDAGSIIDDATAQSLNPGGGKVKRGDLLVQDNTIDVANPQFQYWRVLEPKGNNRWKVVEVVRPGDAMAGDTGSFELRDMIKRLIDRHAESVTAGGDPVMPQRVKYEVRTQPQTVGEKVVKMGGEAAQTATAPARWFFNGPVTSIDRMVNRSPAFREMYYRHVAENAGALTKVDAEQLLQDIDNAVRTAVPKLYAKDPEAAMHAYFGGKKNYKVFKANIDRAIATDAGVGSIDQLEAFAMARSRVDAEEMFFSNVERSNFADAMRIAAPFGSAWAEVFGTYGRAMMENPARIRRAQMAFRGLEGYDPDNDGRGIFFKDAQSGKLMFAFPFSGPITRNFGQAVDFGIGTANALTGLNIPKGMFSTTVPIDAQLVAPVKQLSAGLSVIPSFGPFFQIAAESLFDWREIPNEDSFRAILNPYGSSGIKTFLPGPWMKLANALKSGQKVTDDSVFSTSYMDVHAHLASTGEYDLTDPNEIQRLHEDAISGARTMSVLRGISQFIGPTAGRPEYRYTKKDRDNPQLDEVFYVGELVKAYSDFQAENYETAVSRFIESFGQDAYIYLGAKTRVNAQYSGVEVSKEFENWRRNNKDLVTAHKSVASYLAPVGDRSLSMTAWNNQMADALRYRIDGYDRIELAQFRTGSGLYRAYRNQFPAELTDAQEELLREERERLNKQFPGFPVKPVFTTNELPKVIEDLRLLVADDRTKGNRVRDAINNYLIARDGAVDYVASKSGKTLAAKKDMFAREARGTLYSYGEQLAKAVPDFRRLWDEVLVSEVETSEQG